MSASERKENKRIRKKKTGGHELIWRSIRKIRMV
jgi:hypothetical protein